VIGEVERVINTLVVLIYMVAMIVVGYFAGRASKRTAEDYYLMSREVRFILLMFTYLATLQSMVAFLAGTASYMTHGVAYLILPISQGMLMTFLTLLLGWRYREFAREHGILSGRVSLLSLWDKTWSNYSWSSWLPLQSSIHRDPSSWNGLHTLGSRSYGLLCSCSSNWWYNSNLRACWRS